MLPHYPAKLLVFFLFLLAAVFLIGKDDAWEKITFEKAEMGVPFRITLYAKDRETAREAVAAAFARIEELNQCLSDYEEDSELSRLSRTSGSGQKVRVSDDLWKVLLRSHELAEKTGGAFDVTCGPLVNVWRRARRKAELPDPKLIEEMRARTGWEKMRLYKNEQAVELIAPDMRLDLGAIAKGYACDEALKTLKARGFPSALVAGSGDIVVGDPPPGKKGWHLQVLDLDETPGKQASAAKIVNLSNMALATSGDHFQKLEINGKRYSHILDPRTGQPLTDHSLVSVIAKDGITADSLSTIASVLGPEQGRELIENIPFAAARFLRQPEEKVEAVETSRWAAYLLHETLPAEPAGD